jgi:hypothetical protein
MQLMTMHTRALLLCPVLFATLSCILASATAILRHMHTASFTNSTCAFSSFHSRSVFFWHFFFVSLVIWTINRDLVVLLVKEPGYSDHAGKAVIGFDLRLVPELASFSQQGNKAQAPSSMCSASSGFFVVLSLIAAVFFHDCHNSTFGRIDVPILLSDLLSAIHDFPCANL